MKYLKKYKLFENRESIDRMVRKAQDSGISIDLTDIDYFRELTSKLPNNLQKLVKWLVDGYDPANICTPYEYYMELRNKNLKVPDINKFNSPEELYDELQKIEAQYKVNKMVQELPSNLKRQYKSLEDKSEIDKLFYELNSKDERGQLIKKISRYKNLHNLIEVIKSFLESTSKGFRDMLISLETDSNVNVIWSQNNVIVGQIKDYSASCKFGSSSWCISTNKSYFNQYTDKGTQYFIWDFNLKSTDPLSLIGITMYDIDQIFKNLLGNDKRNDEYQVSAAHDRNDSSIKYNYSNDNTLTNIIKDKGIPHHKIFTNFEDGDILYQKLIEIDFDKTIAFFLYNKKRKILINRIVKYWMENLSKSEIVSINFKLESIHLDNDYLNSDTLEEYIRNFTDSEIISNMNTSYRHPLLKKLFMNILEDGKSFSDVVGTMISIVTDNHTLSSKFTRAELSIMKKRLMKKISSLTDMDDKFDALSEWSKLHGFPMEAKNLMKEIAEHHEDMKENENKVKALMMIGKIFEASKFLDGVRTLNLLNIFNSKVEKENKKEFLSNIISRYTELNVLNKKLLIESSVGYYESTCRYFGERVNDIYEESDESNKIFLADSILNIYPRMGIRLSYKVLDEFVNQPDIWEKFKFGNTIINKLFDKSGPNHINQNIENIKKLYSNLNTLNHNDYVTMFSTGNNDLINSFYKDFIKSIKNSASYNYSYGINSAMRDLIHGLCISRKMKYDMFVKLISTIKRLYQKEDLPGLLEKSISSIDGDIKKFEYLLKEMDSENVIDKSIIMTDIIKDFNENNKKSSMEKIKYLNTKFEIKPSLSNISFISQKMVDYKSFHKFLNPFLTYLKKLAK